MKKLLLIILLLQNISSKQCFGQDQLVNNIKENANYKIKIASSINPLYQIISAITGDKTDNYLVFKSNFSEHNYQLKSDDVKVLKNADLIFMIDKNYEKNLYKLISNSHPKDKILIASEIEKIKLFNLRNNQKYLDYHLWLNPQNAELIALKLKEKLCEIDQKNCNFYHENFRKFQQENQQAILKINHKLEKIKAKNFIFYHDCYQYFEEYFKVTAKLIVDYDHAIDLKITKLKKLDDVIKNNHITCLLGDINDEKNSAQKIAKNYQINFAKLDIIGLSSVVKDNEKQSNSNGYSQILTQIVNDIENCLK